MNKRVLFIGTLPPPIDGMSKATKGVHDGLLEYGATIEVVNISRASLYRGMFSQISRLFDIFRIVIRLRKASRNFDAVYFTVSESTLGNLKDMIIYLSIFGRVDRLIIHLLGGTGFTRILERDNILSHCNKFFLRKMSGVIVEGPRGRRIFREVFTRSNIFELPNFVDEYLFVSQESCMQKYDNISKINVLFLSNMIPEKGFEVLLGAIEALPQKVSDQFEFSFVGGFQYSSVREAFENRVANLEGVRYVGSFVDGLEKKSLYGSSHIFCLPTFYRFEGQPISILEAYASGCAVITTEHGGIPDIFSDGVNGFAVEPDSVESIVACFSAIISSREQLREFALNNIEQAKKCHDFPIFKKEVARIFGLQS